MVYVLQWMQYKQVWISPIVCHLPIDSREGINDFIAMIFRNISGE